MRKITGEFTAVIATARLSAHIAQEMKKAMADQSVLWGSPIELWDLWGIRLMLLGAALGVGALIASLASSFILYKVAAITQLSSDKRIAEATAVGALANAEAAQAKQATAAANERIASLELQTAQAEASMAKAEERIAELNNETARLYSRLAWRVLSDEQQARITARAKELGVQQFSIVTYSDDLEASNLGALIRQSLEKAGWTHGNSKPLDWLDSGVSVETGRAEEQKIAGVAAELVRALNAESVVTKQVLNPKYDAYPKVIFVVVGKKPPTAVDLPGRGIP